MDSIKTFEGHPLEDSYAREELENKIDKPEESPEVGKVLKIKSVNEDGSFVCEWADGTSIVNDVTIDGKSIVNTDGKAVIPQSVPHLYNQGLVIVTTRGGFTLNGWGELTINPIDDSKFAKRNSSDNIVANGIRLGQLDKAVKYSLCDGIAAAWTEAEQAAARERFGIIKGEEVGF